jgi:hypothetical protein
MGRREAERVVKPWDEWLRAHTADLRVIDDEVLTRADSNSRRERPDVEPEDGRARRPPGAVSGGGGGASVLIAEVPRSGDRWNQVNFDIDTIRRYFRVEPGSSQRVFLEQRLPGSTSGSQEVRPCVDSGRSQNYRIEIAAGRGIDYPARGRPIVVFLRTAPRVFRYQLVLPRDDGHTQLGHLLRQAGSSPHRVRRIIVALGELASAWPENAVLS